MVRERFAEELFAITLLFLRLRLIPHEQADGLGGVEHGKACQKQRGEDRELGFHEGMLFQRLVHLESEDFISVVPAGNWFFLVRMSFDCFVRIHATPRGGVMAVKVLPEISPPDTRRKSMAWRHRSAAVCWPNG